MGRLDLSTVDGVDLTGLQDSTAGINIATSAGLTYSEDLHRGIDAPGGRYRIGGQNSTIYVRKGQTLAGAGFGATVLDLSKSVQNTAPGVRLGGSSFGQVDAGGQAVELASMTILAGPGSRGAVDTEGVAGWKVRDVFFSAPGVGVQAAGGDALLTGCMFDLGLTHIHTSRLGNALIANNLHYLGNQQVVVGETTYDTTLVGNQYEYFQYAGILLQTGASGINNVGIVSCNFVQNEQHENTLGGIYIATHQGDVSVTSCRFRNINGYGINYGTGVGNRLTINSCIFDGERTFADYSQSRSMGGVNATNMTTVIKSSSFVRLPGQPILFGGGEPSILIVQDCDFRDNTGGGSEILITNTHPESKVIVIGCVGSGRPLVNNQSAVPVWLISSHDGITRAAAVEAAATMALPPGKRLIAVQGRSEITSIAADTASCDRTVSLQFLGRLVVRHGRNLHLDGDFHAQPGSILTLGCWDGANWRELARSGGA